MPKYEAAELKTELDALKPQLEDMQANLEAMQTNFNVVITNGNFQGKYAESVKAYFSEVQSKAITSLTTIISGMKTAATSLQTNATTLDSSSSAKISSEYVTGDQMKIITTFGESFDAKKKAIETEITNISDIGTFTKPAEDVGSKIEAAKKALKNIDTKVMTFSDTDVSGDITALLADFNSLVAYMGACSGPSGIKYSAGDLGKQPFIAGLNEKVSNIQNQQIDDHVNSLTNMSDADKKKYAELLKKETLTPEEELELRKFLENHGESLLNSGLTFLGKMVAKGIIGGLAPNWEATGLMKAVINPLFSKSGQPISEIIGAGLTGSLKGGLTAGGVTFVVGAAIDVGFALADDGKIDRHEGVDIVASNVGAGLGAGIGFAVGGPIGAAVGGFVGNLAGKAVGAGINAGWDWIENSGPQKAVESAQNAISNIGNAVNNIGNGLKGIFG